MLHDGISDIKAKLENNLAGLNNLVTDLGALPRKCGKLYDDRAESTEQKYSRLSNLDMRRGATDSEYNAALEEDGKLPVIPEDKCYPRKTLEYVYDDDCARPVFPLVLIANGSEDRRSCVN